MSAHMPGCGWDRERQSYTTMAEGCAAPEEHDEVVHPAAVCICGHRGDEHAWGFECEGCDCSEFRLAAGRKTP